MKCRATFCGNILAGSRSRRFSIALHSNEREALAPRGAFLNAYGYYLQKRCRFPSRQIVPHKCLSRNWYFIVGGVFSKNFLPAVSLDEFVKNLYSYERRKRADQACPYL